MKHRCDCDREGIKRVGSDWICEVCANLPNSVNQTQQTVGFRPKFYDDVTPNIEDRVARAFRAFLKRHRLVSDRF